MKINEWMQINFQEPLTFEKLNEFEQIEKQNKIQNCEHDKFYFDIEKMEDICLICKKTQWSINSRKNEKM